VAPARCARRSPSTATSCWCRRRWACRPPSSGKLSRSRAKANYLAGLYRAKTARRTETPRDEAKLVAVTGATGFVGPHLVAALARRGFQAPPAGPSLVAAARRSTASRRHGLGDLSDEAASNAWSTAPTRRPRRRPHQGAPASRFHGRQSRRHGRLSALAPQAASCLLSSLAAREPQLSPYAASKRAAEEVVAGRSGPWLTVRAPAVYGPGDARRWPTSRRSRRGLAPQPKVADARLSLIHVADLAEALALALDRRRPRRPTKSMTARRRLPLPATWPTRRGRALGRRPSLAVPRAVMARSLSQRDRTFAGRSVQILTPAKVNEIFHRDWTAHDRRLAAALGSVRASIWRPASATPSCGTRKGWL
jgi:uncharacterized protein YbjT (DUF2867 family)